jgi:uncharacterized protein YjiS (DUF1127 family)
MLFLDLYGVPRASIEAKTQHLPRVLRPIAQRIERWSRAACDRSILRRMTLRELEDLQLSWPDDIRNIRAHS